MAKRIEKKNEIARIPAGAFSPDELKLFIRDGLVSMTIAEREDFIRNIQAEFRALGMDLRAHLVPLGIPGRSPVDLTPTEVGHLIRYIKINTPHAMARIERVIAQFPAFAEKLEESGHRLAA
jgi:hypothetical protein